MRNVLVVLIFVVIGATVAVGGTLIWALHNVPLLAAPPERRLSRSYSKLPTASRLRERARCARPTPSGKTTLPCWRNAVTSIEDRRVPAPLGDRTLCHCPCRPQQFLRRRDCAGRQHDHPAAGQGPSLSTSAPSPKAPRGDGRALAGARLGKDEILARYLNSVYFGAGAVGADAAAKRFSARRRPISTAGSGDACRPDQGALAPRARDVIPMAARRGRQSSSRPWSMPARSTSQPAAAAKPVQLAMAPDTHRRRQLFPRLLRSRGDRLDRRPPLDCRSRRHSIRGCRTLAERTSSTAHRRGHGRPSQAALVALAPDGAVLAMVGGARLRREPVQPGDPGAAASPARCSSSSSTWRRSSAAHAGQRDRRQAGPDRRLAAARITTGAFRAGDSEDAFAQSLNTVAAQLAQAVGIDQVIAMAKISASRAAEDGPSLALGSTEVTLLEMTGAYAGSPPIRSIQPYSIAAFGAEERPLLPAGAAPTGRSGTPRRGAADAAARGGRQPRAPARRRGSTGFAAGKTGTTEEYRDAWFVGFTDRLVVGVWVGNDDNTPMDQVTGGDAAGADLARLSDQGRQRRRVRATPAATPEGAPAVDQTQTSSIGSDALGEFSPAPRDWPRTLRSLRLCAEIPLFPPLRLHVSTL